jgi:hypothetical protein
MKLFNPRRWEPRKDSGLRSHLPSVALGQVECEPLNPNPCQKKKLLAEHTGFFPPPWLQNSPETASDREGLATLALQTSRVSPSTFPGSQAVELLEADFEREAEIKLRQAALPLSVGSSSTDASL